MTEVEEEVEAHQVGEVCFPIRPNPFVAAVAGVPDDPIQTISVPTYSDGTVRFYDTIMDAVLFQTAPETFYEAAMRRFVTRKWGLEVVR